MTQTEKFTIEREQREGRFERQGSAFRGEIVPEAGRYHLYVSYACPWAHRTLIVRALRGLEDAIAFSSVDPIRDSRGWAFTGGDHVDHANGWSFLSQAYTATDPSYDARVTTPTLWDLREGRVVSDESADIVRALGSPAWDHLAGNPGLDLYPEQHRAEIDELNERIYDTVNNGVYRAGFATTQEAYEEAVHPLFATLDELEERLVSRRFLVAEDEPTEADWRLFVTLLRFDAVYVGHFKCNLRRIVDLPNLWRYARELRAWPKVEATVRMDEIKRHYYVTHPSINPTGVVPAGPLVDWTPED